MLITLVKCRCLAIDIRGHGDSFTLEENDLSADTLSRDVSDVIGHLYGEETKPPVILIGHSMGGAVAVHAAHKSMIESLVGLVVIDVVEGTALDALTSMQSFLRGRPTGFASLEAGIEWCVKTGQIRNIESAKVSMVGQLKRVNTNSSATCELEENRLQPSSSSDTERASSTITEEEEDRDSTVPNAADNTEEFKKPQEKNNKLEYTWRINLSSTEIYWRGWFEGLSKKFLSCEVPKMLLLAGMDRLDKDLTVGQMQGKFQMQVLPQCGHAVHEDSPDKVADILANFMVRNKFAEPSVNFTRTFPAC